mmetsp:Transcript_3245/g.11746  ORF Transcript_3245/g.11746 Transcript_3245/m.11746 type:complete len:417 (+) Transcript_3245:412-1662(+)
MLRRCPRVARGSGACADSPRRRRRRLALGVAVDAAAAAATLARRGAVRASVAARGSGRRVLRGQRLVDDDDLDLDASAQVLEGLAVLHERVAAGVALDVLVDEAALLQELPERHVVRRVEADALQRRLRALPVVEDAARAQQDVLLRHRRHDGRHMRAQRQCLRVARRSAHRHHQRRRDGLQRHGRRAVVDVGRRRQHHVEAHERAGAARRRRQRQGVVVGGRAPRRCASCWRSSRVRHRHRRPRRALDSLRLTLAVYCHDSAVGIVAGGALPHGRQRAAQRADGRGRGREARLLALRGRCERREHLRLGGHGAAAARVHHKRAGLAQSRARGRLALRRCAPLLARRILRLAACLLVQLVAVLQLGRRKRVEVLEDVREDVVRRNLGQRREDADRHGDVDVREVIHQQRARCCRCQ